ncbi:MAG TPA: hypothetical protein VI685_10885 [Candidatus Angelobacter sp.]
MRNRSFRFLFVVMMLTASQFQAQGPVKSQPVGRQSMTLTPEERSAMQNTLLSDARVQQVVNAGGARVTLGEAQADKYETLAYINGETQKLPTHRVWATVFNPKTNKALEVLMALEKNTILEVHEINPSDVPLSREDVAEALALAKASDQVRSLVGSSIDQFVASDPGNTIRLPFAAQALRVRSADPNDSCSTDRCLNLFFKTENGYLPLRTSVDLTRHTLTVSAGQPAKGKHP